MTILTSSAKAAYQRQVLAEKVSNFESCLPAPTSELAAQTMKGPYVFDFIPFREDTWARSFRDTIPTLNALPSGFARTP